MSGEGRPRVGVPKAEGLRLGIAAIRWHERLVEQCDKYLDRGYISEGEFRDLSEYVYEPYRHLGGNGTGEAMYERTRDLIFEKRREG